MPTRILSREECRSAASLAPPELASVLAAALGHDAVLDAAGALALVGWPVPREVSGGACSSRPGDTVPFDALRGEYGQAAADVDVSSARVRRLARLAALMRALQAKTSADWLGVYRVVRRDGGAALQKEAYVGAPSRAFFPLTVDFAAHSNNSAVALSGCARLIDDAHSLGDDDAYYVCDARVRAELCAPIFSAGGEVIGIVDAEAFAPAHFDAARTSAVLLACEQLGACDLLRELLV
jgi:hypothetical protein